jgi:hypothetical protein
VKSEESEESEESDASTWFDESSPTIAQQPSEE